MNLNAAAQITPRELAHSPAPAARVDESVVGVVAGLLVTGLSGGPWSDGHHSVCETCAGWLLAVDDASMSGAVDAPVPCICCALESWDESRWAAFRSRMDEIVAAWTVYYGPGDEALMDQRRAWIRAHHQFYSQG